MRIEIDVKQKQILFSLTELKLIVVGLTSSSAPCLWRLTMLCNTRSALAAALGSPLFASAVITFVVLNSMLGKV